MDYVKESYELAKKRYAQYGIDTDQVLETLKKIPISMHCWQGDDVIGFENPEGELTGGIQTTGNYPGKARTADELRSDIEKAFSMIPGKHRLNLHAVYGDFDGDVERDKIEPKHFKKWVEWAKKNGVGLDFNPTCFSHPMSESGMTLSHPRIKRCVTSGSATARRAVKLPPTWEKSSVRRPLRISGSPTE